MAVLVNSQHEQIFHAENSYLVGKIIGVENQILFAQHWHKTLELLFVDEGKFHIDIAGEEFVAKSGDIVIINPTLLHKGHTENTVTSYRVLQVKLNLLCEQTEASILLNSYINRNAIFHCCVHDEELFAIGDQLMALQSDKQPENTLLSISLLYRLLHILHTRHRDASFINPTAHQRFQSVLDYIDEHYCEPITSKKLAATFGYEEAYFCRLFKSVTALRPTEYIRILRLEAAQRMLSITHRHADITSIAEACGFSDTNYFSRCFKIRYGVTATQYRKHKLK